MGSKNQHMAKYKNAFEKWDRDRTPIEYKIDDQTYTYIPDQDEVFRQCYLPYTQKTDDLLFYKARNKLPKHWFCSNKGTIIAIEGSIKSGYHVSFYQGQISNSKRLQVKIDNRAYSRETIVGLVFADQIRIEKITADYIEQNGLNAFHKRKGSKIFVEAHHVDTNIPYVTMAEGLEKASVNCSPDRIMFLKNEIHDIFDKVESIRDRLLNGTATPKDIKKLSKEMDIPDLHDQITAYIPREQKRSGSIQTVEKVTLKNANNESIDILDFVNDWLLGKRDNQGKKVPDDQRKTIVIHKE